MEESVCFRCRSVFVSFRALEVHLMSCDAPYEPPRSTPWAFIPPPASLSSTREPRFYHPNFQNRRQQAQRVPLRVNSNPQPPSPDARRPSPQFQRGWADRNRRNTVPSSTTGLAAKCTKCGISFPDALSLGEHFAESPAHPYSVRAPSNSWEPPPFMGYTAEPKTRPALDTSSGIGDAAKVTCECGKTFRTNSGLEQHRKDSKNHMTRPAVGVRPGGEGGRGRSKTQPWAWGDDEFDDIASAFTKLFIA